MKLILCPHCKDVKKLDYEFVYCNCKKSYERYLKDGLNAEINKEVIPIGFNNHSLVDAIKNRREFDLGERFESFIIEKNCKRIRIID